MAEEQYCKAIELAKNADSDDSQSGNLGLFYYN